MDDPPPAAQVPDPGAQPIQPDNQQGDAQNIINLDTLLRLRNGLRKATDRAINIIRDSLHAIVISPDLLSDVQTHRDALSFKLHRLNDLDSQIFPLLGTEQADDDLQEAETNAFVARKAMNDATHFLVNNDTPIKFPINPTLPKITLPPFNGEPDNWQGFWEIYSSQIHENRGHV